jgi:tRNA 5-methylaminomethyl-2-thiouridine biosynthesis bifunctional protein
MSMAPKHAVIIGAGIAGCSTAYALAQRGMRITLIERNSEIANEASGNPLAMLYPRLSRDNAASEFALAGYLYSLRLYTSLALGPDDFNVCGLLQLGFNARELARIKKVATQHYPTHIVKHLSANEASAVAGISIAHDALYFPEAAWVNPKALCQRLITHKNITLITLTNINKLLKNNDLFEIFSDGKLIASADIVVLANAHAAQQLLPNNAGNAMQLSTVRGQISVLKSTAESSQLQSIVCSDGYLSPTLNEQHCLGATFTPNNNAPEVTIADHQANLAKLAHISPTLAQNLQPNIIGGRVSVRCTTADYFPLTGELLDSLALQSAPPRPNAKASSLPWSKGLYINVGHGSKGFSTASICAELLASAICKEALPIIPALAAHLNPNRFLLRTLGLKRLAQTLPTCSELAISG